MSGVLTARQMVVLASDRLLVRVDAAHGAEILDLIDLDTGRQLLGRPPFGSAPPLTGDQNEEVWTESYRGGWQTVLPNAGNPCHVNGEYHGFHGCASADPWSVEEADGTHVELRWRGHGLAVTKRIAVGDAVRVDYDIAAERTRVPLVAIEHLAVGLELLEPVVAIDIRAGAAYELDERTGPVRPPSGCARWPEITPLHGAAERADGWPIDTPRSRLLVATSIDDGWCAVRNPVRDLGLALRWDQSTFGHCWMWQENRVTEGPWRRQTETLVVEPASVPHTLGLARAIEEDQAIWLAADEHITPWIVVRPCGGVRRVTGVAMDGTVTVEVEQR
jgi:hypothetical protein